MPTHVPHSHAARPEAALLAASTGLSRDDLAAVLGVSRSVLQSWLAGRRGRRSGPSEQQIRALARLARAEEDDVRRILAPARDVAVPSDGGAA